MSLLGHTSVHRELNVKQYHHVRAGPSVGDCRNYTATVFPIRTWHFSVPGMDIVSVGT